MKQVWGGSCQVVGWLKPGQLGSVPSEVIPGSVLSPLGIKSSEGNNNILTVKDQEIKMSVYPNPLGNNLLNIEIDNLNLESELRIYTISGIECHRELILNSGTIRIDRSIFKNGIYIIKLSSGSYIKTSKLVVQ